MIFLAKSETGFLWKPSVSIENLKPAEKSLISSNDWIVVDVDNTSETLITHILKGHCVFENGEVSVLPEEQWAEYIPSEDE